MVKEKNPSSINQILFYYPKRFSSVLNLQTSLEKIKKQTNQKTFEGRAKLSVVLLYPHPKDLIKMLFLFIYNKINFKRSYDEHKFPVMSASQRCFCVPWLPQALICLAFASWYCLHQTMVFLYLKERQMLYCCILDLNRHNKKRMNGRMWFIESWSHVGIPIEQARIRDV